MQKTNQDISKLKKHTFDKVQDNLDKISVLFPHCIVEAKNDSGETVQGIDFAMLKQELSSVLVDDKQERYQFTWPDKKKSVLNANQPINKTLRPCREESVNFDTTQNLYIEGDNLEVLKILQETYLNKVKMIYIDPPYNTGKDFVYPDNYTIDSEEFADMSGYYDDEGNRLYDMRQNNESNGRFHTDWLNMMYPRLKIARDLLSEDGVIFISIDDNEVHNLRKICDEIFGAVNFVAQFTWKRRSGANDAKNNVSMDHEYVLCFSKSQLFELNGIVKTFENYKNPDNDPRGPWIRDNLTCGKTASQRPNLFYSITDPKTGREYSCNPDHVWRFEKSKMEKFISEGKVLFSEDGSSLPAYKRHKEEIRSETKPFSSILETKLNSVATKELRLLLDGQIFDYSKTINLISQLIEQASNHDSIILDFFSGSSTTAHAVMQLNAEDGGNRKFIMVQVPEKTDEKSEAFKAGYKNICEIGKERIRRAGAKIKEENPLTTQDLDCGFRVLKVDSSNTREEIRKKPHEVSQANLFDDIDNMKLDRTEEDLLFQAMLQLRLMPSAKIETSIIAGKKVFNVEDNFLIACFDKDVSDETIIEIAKLEPHYFVTQDSSMATDSVSSNFDNLFKQFSPETIRKVL